MRVLIIEDEKSSCRPARKPLTGNKPATPGRRQAAFH